MKAWPACEIWLRFLVTTAMARSGILCVVWSSKTLPALRLSSANRRTVMPTPNPRSAKGTISTVVASSHSGSSTTPCDWKTHPDTPGCWSLFRHTIGAWQPHRREHGAFQMAKCVTRDKRILNPANGVMSRSSFSSTGENTTPRSIRRAAARQSFQASMPVMVLMRTLG